MEKPHIGISHSDQIDTSFFKSFENEVDRPEINYLIESREPQLYACIEWLLPTAIIAFIGKAYFEEFLREMGKDHYHILKSALVDLTKKSVNETSFEPSLVATPGKISNNNPYTLTYSIIAEGRDGYRFKLLIPKYSPEIDYDLIVNKFMDFIAEYHLLEDNSSLNAIIQDSGAPGGTVLVHFNPETNNIEWKDPIPLEVRIKNKNSSQP